MANEDRASSVGLGLALGAAAATHVRVPGVPLRIGDLALGLWAAYAVWGLARHGRPPLSPLARRLLAFWVVSGVAMVAGALVASTRGVAAPESAARHDAVALPFTAGVCLLAVTQRNAEERISRAFMWAIPAVVIPAVVLLVAGPDVWVGSFHIRVWWLARFRGAAENVNQLALALLLVPFLGVRLSLMQTRPAAGVLVRLCTAAALVVGIAGRSDALLLGWMLGFGVAAVWTIVRRVRALERADVRRRMALPAAVLVAVGGAAALAPAIQARARAVYEYDRQGDTRIRLWKHGAQAWVVSPLVGLGPGPHSGMEAPFGDMEAHNTLIDWGSGAGIAGVAVLVAVLGWVARRVWAGRTPVVMGAFVALVTFSMFHYVPRQPVFWVGLAVLAALARPATGAPAPDRPPGRGAPRRARRAGVSG